MVTFVLTGASDLTFLSSSLLLSGVIRKKSNLRAGDLAVIGKLVIEDNAVGALKEHLLFHKLISS